MSFNFIDSVIGFKVNISISLAEQGNKLQKKNYIKKKHLYHDQLVLIIGIDLSALP